MPSILIIEESAVSIQQLEFLLQPMGFQTHVASNVAEVFGQRGMHSALRDHPPQMIILSTQLAEMSGFDVLTKIRSMVHATEIPVIMLGPSLNEAQVLEAKHRGAQGFMAKPISADKLFTQMAHAAKDAGVQEIARILSSYLDLGVRAEIVRPDLKVGDANLSYLLEIIDEDEELLRELVRSLVEQLPGQLGKIEAAIAQKDANQLRQAAHMLKGSIANFGAALITETALELEKSGRASDFNGVERRFRSLKADAEKLRGELIAWLAF